MDVALIPSKASLWLGGDHLLKYLRGRLKQAIQFGIVTLNTSVRQFVTLAAREAHLILRTV